MGDLMYVIVVFALPLTVSVFVVYFVFTMVFRKLNGKEEIFDKGIRLFKDIKDTDIIIIGDGKHTIEECPHITGKEIKDVVFNNKVVEKDGYKIYKK